MPRLFGELVEWFDPETLVRPGRLIRLPGNAGDEKISAKYADGILEVKVPLAEHRPTGRHVPVALPAK
ncbi:Hsp20 family protein [Hamadaea tsunoensis]|uniref:Hsp20 family protein n=1 Tax=Hamadaea tsunoensis TaxID=53368 RepID=UPI00040DBB5D|nr:Hsp20 family protein [Hamadaea tsunoensis]